MKLRIFVALLIKIYINLPMMLLGYFLVPVGIKKGFKGWLWPWGNDDHPDNGGNFWKKKCGDSFWCAWKWFAIRNPTFNFTKYKLGFLSEGKAIFIDGTGTKVGDTRGEGWYYARERWAWEFYYIKAYTIFGFRRCVRLRAGWKIMGKGYGEIAQFCFAPNPCHPYTAK